MKKIAVIGTAGIPAKYGGFETLVQNLVEKWINKFDITVYCSTKYYQKNERLKKWKGANLIYLPIHANGIFSILYDIISIFHAILYADVLLVLGVSGGIILPFVRIFTNKKIIVNIDGLEWRRDKWGRFTKEFLKFSEILAVKFSDADITDNLALKKYTSRYYNTLSYLVPYGADHVKKPVPSKSDLAKYSFLLDDYAFKVCRIEPENNVHVVLEAFKNLRLKLVIVGNWNTSLYGQELKDKYKNFNNIYLLDPIYDQIKLDLLRSNCKVYIHGHSAGGTNPSLVEAMYLGLPIIAFDVMFNHCTTFNSAKYFKSSSSLEKILKDISDYELSLIGKAMEKIALDEYTWSKIADRYSFLIDSFDYLYSKKQIYPNITSLKASNLMDFKIMHYKNLI